MSLASLLNQSLTIEHVDAIGTDMLGNETHATTTTTVAAGLVQQTASSEVTVDQQTYRVDWDVYLPAGTRVDANDTVLAGGVRLEVIGPPEQVWNPRTRTYSHVRFKARSVTG